MHQSRAPSVSSNLSHRCSSSNGWKNDAFRSSVAMYSTSPGSRISLVASNMTAASGLTWYKRDATNAACHYSLPSGVRCQQIGTAESQPDRQTTGWYSEKEVAKGQTGSNTIEGQQKGGGLRETWDEHTAATKQQVEETRKKVWCNREK